MSSGGAISLDPQVFAPSAISEDTHALNQKLMGLTAIGPTWYEVCEFSNESTDQNTHMLGRSEPHNTVP